jgi:dolichol kinase
MLRKLFHLTGSIIAVIYLLTDKQTAIIATASLFVVDIFLEMLRIKGFFHREKYEEGRK